MIDNLFNAALAVCLLVGSSLALGSALQERPPGARILQAQAPLRAPSGAGAQHPGGKGLTQGFGTVLQVGLRLGA
jgi:hypothetical protein